ncbi:MAG: chemotaxis protein CheB [Vulcanimicrobiota bacterium]
MKIGILNHSYTVAHGLSESILAHTRHQVAWLALDCEQALAQSQFEPADLILLDVAVPGALRLQRQLAPASVLVATASISRASGAVFEAMSAGALDAVEAPTGAESQLLTSLETVARLIEDKPPARSSGCPLVAIGSSAGGPAALAELLGQLPAGFEAAIVIVQHIDAGFSAGLASWLNDQTALQVAVAEGGEYPRAGQALVAAQPAHLVITPEGSLAYQPEPDTIHRPSIDVFFESVAQHWPNRCLGVLLTGMGRDGAQGLLRLRQQGGHTIAQDEATSAIFGMPAAAIELGAACQVLPLGAIPEALQRRLARSTTEKDGSGEYEF